MIWGLDCFLLSFFCCSSGASKGSPYKLEALRNLWLLRFLLQGPWVSERLIGSCTRQLLPRGCSRSDPGITTPPGMKKCKCPFPCRHGIWPQSREGIGSGSPGGLIVFSSSSRTRSEFGRPLSDCHKIWFACPTFCIPPSRSGAWRHDPWSP